ncbi:putative ribonuclease H-like domain-containing protein [Tanacetum coccineum]
MYQFKRLFVSFLYISCAVDLEVTRPGSLFRCDPFWGVTNSVWTNVNIGRSKQPVSTSNSNSFSPVRPQDTAVKTSTSYNWRRTRPNSNYNSGSNYVRTVNVKGPQRRPKSSKGWAHDCNKDHLMMLKKTKGDRLPLEVAKATKLGLCLEFCGNKGIKQEYSNARTPQQNGVAERMIRTLIEAARTMLADSLLPTTFWAEAVKLHNLKAQEKEAYSTGILEDTPEILAFRRDLDELAQKHLRKVPKNKATSNNDFNNLPTEVTVSPIPTLRIHNIHPQSQILGDPKLSVQTRSRVRQTSGAHALVWILVDLPHEAKVIGTKWVYRNKRDERGVVARNKARLVAQGHRQEEGIDYNEVFALVARIEVISLFLAFALFMRFIVYQMDVKSAFLYGTIDEEVYVSQPPGFVDPNHSKKVYKVVKALYGLHQAPRAWYATLSIFLEKHGYRRGANTNLAYVPRESTFDLEAFSDSDYAGENLDRKSTTGGCQFIGSRLISWQCKKQTIVATSTTEAEYVAAASCYGQVRGELGEYLGGGLGVKPWGMGWYGFGGSGYGTGLFTGFKRDEWGRGNSGSGLTADSSVLTLTLAFLDFGLDFAQSFPFHAQFCHFGLEAIKLRFRGNKESKKMQKNVLKHQFENFSTASNESLDKAYDRFQKLISQLEVHGAPISKEDINQNTTSGDFRVSTAGGISQVSSIPCAHDTLVAQDGLGGYDWSNDFDVELVNYALMAISSSSSSCSSDNEVQKCFKQCLESFKTLQKNYDSKREKHSKARLEIQGYELALESLESRILVHEKNELAWGEKYESSNEENIPVNDRFSKADGFHVVPPPITGNFLTPRADISFAGLDEYAIRKKIINSKTTDLNTKTSETFIIEEWTSDDEDYVCADRTGSLLSKIPKRDFKSVLDLDPLRFTNYITLFCWAIKGILLQDHAVVDSGCSSHMTGNKAYLSDYEDFNGGFVAFGSDPKGELPRNAGVYGLDLKNYFPSGGAIADGLSFVYLGGKIPIDASTLPNADLPIHLNMPDLEDASDTLPNDGIFNGAYDDDEDVGCTWMIFHTWITPCCQSYSHTTEIIRNHSTRTNFLEDPYIKSSKKRFSFSRFEYLWIYPFRKKGNWQTILEFSRNKRDDEKLCCEDKAKLVVSRPILVLSSKKTLVKDEDGVEVDVHEYRSMIGSLMYLTASRPDIMFAVCACARDSPFELEAFSDSDYAGASLNRNNNLVGVNLLVEDSLSWQCKITQGFEAGIEAALAIIIHGLNHNLLKLKFLAGLATLGNTSGSAEDSMQLKGMMVLVPTLVTRINSLRVIVKETKQTLGNVVLKLVKKVKSLENALKRKSLRIHNRESTDFVILQKLLRESQEEEISPTFGAAKTCQIKDAYQEREENNTGIERLVMVILKFDSEQHKERKAQVQFEAQFYTEEDWDAIRAKLEANAELSKDVLGKDFPEQIFAKGMADEKIWKKSFRQRLQETKGLDDKDVPTAREKKLLIAQEDTETDKEESVEAMNPTPLTTKSDIYMSFGAMIKDFTREDLIELYRLVMQKYELIAVKCFYDRVLWSDLRTMFDPPLNEDGIFGAYHFNKRWLEQHATLFNNIDRSEKAIEGVDLSDK